MSSPEAVVVSIAPSHMERKPKKEQAQAEELAQAQRMRVLNTVRLIYYQIRAFRAGR